MSDYELTGPDDTYPGMPWGIQRKGDILPWARFSERWSAVYMLARLTNSPNA